MLLKNGYEYFYGKLTSLSNDFSTQLYVRMHKHFNSSRKGMGMEVHESTFSGAVGSGIRNQKCMCHPYFSTNLNTYFYSNKISNKSVSQFFDFFLNYEQFL